MLTLSARNRVHATKRAPPQKIDELLHSIGLIRHVVPKDGSSLFRCISQCVFLTQSYHMAVRKNLLQFAMLQTKEFSQMTQLPVSEYAKKISDTKSDGELLDMRIAAILYKINIAFYVDADPFIPLAIETPNSVKTLNICLNYEGAYDLVFIHESVVNMSFCQAIVYEMLYKNVYKLSGVDFAVKEMLYERKLPSSRSNDRISLEKRATCNDMKELLELGITPFPFKVAKALTPKLFRNTEYDIWLYNKKEKFYGKWNNWEFKVGSKCMVSVGGQEYGCYIQDIREKHEPVEVYIKDLAKKMCVEFNKLKLMPVEEDVREMTDNSVQGSQVFSTLDDGNKYRNQVSEHIETPVPYNNPSFIHRSAVFPSSSYVHQYQQQPPLPMSPLNLCTSGNAMHPCFMSTSPILSNDFRPCKEQSVFLEQSSDFNKNHIPPPNFGKLPHNITGLHIPSVPPSWCSRCNDSEESCQINNNRGCQPWLLPAFDDPVDKSQK